MVSSWKMTASLLAGLAAMAAARKCPAGLIKCIYVGPDDECYNICTPLIGECTCPPTKSFPSLGNGPPVTLPNTDSGCTTKQAIKGWKQCKEESPSVQEARLTADLG
ncbi:hypothetical protein CABS01_02175 [Colletotrichum abscissum]|uniref:Extracellular membrane protein CFEM domain-containing protein n=1 Tax=Colletotrichum abscissum TaxID=1671311 RepID=A0A9P9XJP0_9PEZI|nr:uncharacterized protein CABS01_02175 [Colletotrichum abscissum]KAI3554472.1 hypothetical protein CABS02_05289 [Colletotrichum abscissum]KAK1488545.1 hypothetical protein CABS01_02175 [Colletotrichum abscissum]